jgi:hypothetical protein
LRLFPLQSKFSQILPRKYNLYDALWMENIHPKIINLSAQIVPEIITEEKPREGPRILPRCLHGYKLAFFS